MVEDFLVNNSIKGNRPSSSLHAILEALLLTSK